MGFYIPEDDILHNQCRENFKSYISIYLMCVVYNGAAGTQRILNVDWLSAPLLHWTLLQFRLIPPIDLT
jgi:hypothetical protein